MLKNGFTQPRARLCARLFADASRDGVYTHGLNRFPRFIEYIQKGYIQIHAIPEKLEACGALERWNGKMGPGNLNAHFAMDRAIKLARENGVGCVALQRTNHWMRAGSYGLQAAEAGCIGMCWTNTIPNLPPWGGVEPKLGNNPLVLAIPRPEGPVVLDMALSMFSYGKLEAYALRHQELPVEGGYDSAGRLTRDPEAIMETQRPLPVGFWKGSGLSLLLDLVAVMLSGGNSTLQVGKGPVEIGLSQVFITFDLTRLSGSQTILDSINATLEDLHHTMPVEPDGKIYYPGERMLLTRKENLEQGIPVDEGYWQQVLNL